MMIYKLFRQAEWDALDAEGMTFGAPVDLLDGYIHFSTKETVAATAAKYFAGMADLVLVRCDPAAFGAALLWEPARGGALFPHLYRALRRAECLRAEPLPLGPDGHIFPEDLT